jgi:hypothetical protein
MRAATVIAFAGLLALGSCGGDESTSTSTVTEVAPSTTSTTTGTQTTTTQSSATTEQTESTTGPQPGSGAGAANAVIAAAAVLTTGGTTQQACGSYVTERFIHDSYGGEANCIAARRKSALARSILVGGEDETSTRIVVEARGGPYDGVKITVDLVEEDGGYRVDALKAHVPAGP